MLTWLTTIRADSGQTSSRTVRPFSRKSASCLYNIHNHFGKSDNRCQLDRAVQLDHLNGLVLAVVEVILGNVWVLRCHTDLLVVLQQLTRGFRSADTHAALA